MFNKNDETAITVETIVVMMKHTHTYNTCKKEKKINETQTDLNIFKAKFEKWWKLKKKIENTFKTLQKKKSKQMRCQHLLR